MSYRLQKFAGGQFPPFFQLLSDLEFCFLSKYTKITTFIKNNWLSHRLDNLWLFDLYNWAITIAPTTFYDKITTLSNNCFIIIASFQATTVKLHIFFKLAKLSNWCSYYKIYHHIFLCQILGQCAKGVDPHTYFLLRSV